MRWDIPFGKDTNPNLRHGFPAIGEALRDSLRLANALHSFVRDSVNDIRNRSDQIHIFLMERQKKFINIKSYLNFLELLLFLQVM